MKEQYDPLAVYLAKGVLDMAREIANERKEISHKLASCQSRTGEIRQSDLLKDSGISKGTLKEWENNGLNRIVRGGSIFYLLEDLHKFNY